MLPSDIYYMVELALLFILLTTGAWRKSMTTVLFVVSLIVVFYNTTSQLCPIDTTSLCVATIFSVLAVFRALFHKKFDSLVRS